MGHSYNYNTNTAELSSAQLTAFATKSNKTLLLLHKLLYYTQTKVHSEPSRIINRMIEMETILNTDCTVVFAALNY